MSRNLNTRIDEIAAALGLTSYESPTSENVCLRGTHNRYYDLVEVLERIITHLPTVRNDGYERRRDFSIKERGK